MAPPTKARPKSPPPSTPKKTAPAESGRPMHPVAFVVGLMAILVGIAAAGMLSLDHFEILKAPGCGTNAGCDAAANSKFGKIPVPGTEVKWPTSHAGFAYFVAVGAVWVLSRRGMSPGLRAMIIAGTIGSLFYTTQILLHLDKYLCPWCLTCHGSNFVLFALTFFGTGAARTAGRDIAVGALAFGVATAGLVGVGSWSDKAARDKGERELNESIATMIGKTEQDAARANATRTAAELAGEGLTDAEAAARPAGVSPDMSGVAAPAAPSGELAKGPPELRDRPPAIEIKGYSSGRGITGAYRIGYEDAPIRIVMFSDYQCKDCQRVEKELFQLLRKRNDIMFSHRHFPFCRPCNPAIDRDMHPNACWGALAVESVGKLYGPEGYWMMHEWLFERNGGFTNEELDAGLRSMGFDTARVTAEMNAQMKGGPLLKRVQEDVAQAQTLGLHYTPMTFVNGVEIRAFRTSGALTRAVMALAERNPPLGSPEFDVPPTAAEKYVEDWAAAPSFGPFAGDRFEARLGPADAAVRIDAWIDYSSTDAQRLDAQIRKIVAERGDTSYTVRLFPLNKECVNRPLVDNRPFACEMAKAAEATGLVAGVDAYFKVHAWLFEHTGDFSMENLRAFLVEQGMDADAIFARMSDPEVAAAITDDVGVFYGMKMNILPKVYVNLREVPRWDLKDHDIIRAIVERAADGR